MNTAQQIERLEFAIALFDEIDREGVWRSSSRVKPYSAAKLASDLIRAHRRLHRMAEDDCNGFHTEAEQEAHDAKVERARNRVATMLRPYGIGATFGGDPRGSLLELVLPRTKRTNGWGGQGYCVPR